MNKKYLKPIMIILLSVVIIIYFIKRKNKTTETLITRIETLPKTDNSIQDWFNNYFGFTTTETQKKLVAL